MRRHGPRIATRASKLKRRRAAASPFPRWIQIFRARIAALRDSIQPASGIPFEANFARSSPRARASAFPPGTVRRTGGPVRASAFSRTGIESVGRFWLGSPWTPEETRTWMVSLPSSLGIGPICFDKEIRPSHRASIWRRRSRRPSPRAIFWGERPSTPEPSPRNWLTHGSFFLGTG